MQKRKDGREVFRLEDHYPRYWAGEGVVPVLLIHRDEAGRLRYMNATEAIRRARTLNNGREPKQIDFTGLPFDRGAVIQLRDERLNRQ